MTPPSPLRVVCFELRRQEFGFPITTVRETLVVQPISKVFLTPPCLAGVFNLRGEIVPAIDLGVLLGMGPTRITDATRIIVVKHELGNAGILVDRMLEQRRLEEPVDPAPSNLAPAMAALLIGIATTTTGTVRVVDCAAVFDVDELVELRSALATA